MQRLFPSCNCMGSAPLPSQSMISQLNGYLAEPSSSFPKPNLLTPSLYIIKAAAGTRCGSFLEHESTFKIPQLDQNVRHVYLPSASATEERKSPLPWVFWTLLYTQQELVYQIDISGLSTFTIQTSLRKQDNRKQELMNKVVILQGIARTQFPTDRNCAPEFPTFEEIAEVSYLEVQ